MQGQGALDPNAVEKPHTISDSPKMELQSSLIIHKGLTPGPPTPNPQMLKTPIETDEVDAVGPAHPRNPKTVPIRAG